MTITPSEWWVMATACVCAAACGLVGAFLVLRRMSMLGDAISHAILPGLAGAFLLTGTRDPLAMLAGATIVGLATAGASAALHRWAKVPEDAAMGVVFSSMFALGVLLINFAADRVDLDPGCVLYGLLEGVAFDTVRVLGVELPRAFVVLSVALVVNLLLLIAFAKEVKLVCFDAALASSMGISAGLVHYALMALVAGTSVAAFEAVGSILVIAMLVVPGATALLLSQRLERVLFLSVLIAVACAALGTLLGILVNTSVPGAICVVLGIVFAVAVIAGPRGVIAQQFRRASLALRIRREDLLGELIRAQERGSTDRMAELRRGPRGFWAMRQLITRGLVTSQGETSPSLTPRGVEEATRILAAHRLWESYLASRVGLPVDHVHDPSERIEHFITPELEQSLREQMKQSTDPQGKVIPQPTRNRADA
jgi:manganese/zinc/iron transport system permease protein